MSADEKNAYEQLDFFYKRGLGYAQEMANRPQTPYTLEDLPVGLAAWMLDHDARSQALIARIFDGATAGLTRDDILDNVTLYWLTSTAVSSARLYAAPRSRRHSPPNSGRPSGRCGPSGAPGGARRPPPACAAQPFQAISLSGTHRLIAGRNHLSIATDASSQSMLPSGRLCYPKYLIPAMTGFAHVPDT